MPAAETLVPPPVWLLALEGRAWLELAAFVPGLPLLSRTPRGDGHPVLVLPGLLASDVSTRPLRAFLRRQGYHVHGWRLGRNVGASPGVIARLAARLHALHRRHDRSVSLVGWSLGGIYARELARRFPGEVRQVITLASPFRDPSATAVARFFGRRPRDQDGPFAASMGLPLPVPATSILSRSDGIVAWRSCLEEDGPRRENVVVESSHCGMGHHVAALAVIADRLAQPEGTWAPFSAWGFGPWRAERLRGD
jgi:pimeloyl-ACP methyl ester carboxylesterase